MRQSLAPLIVAALLGFSPTVLSAACEPDGPYVYCTTCSYNPGTHKTDCCTSMFYQGEFVTSYCDAF
ncbi:MAG: hypothetical protein IT353_01765 [Gemmatimonadaceae bacterium]|nr:hypothetical protein [Gemmatimonadaceae bacterium]